MDRAACSDGMLQLDAAALAAVVALAVKVNTHQAEPQLSDERKRLRVLRVE